MKNQEHSVANVNKILKIKIIRHTNKVVKITIELKYKITLTDLLGMGLRKLKCFKDLLFLKGFRSID